MLRRTVRVVMAALLILCCVSLAGSSSSIAQDHSAAYRDLATGADFRLRVSAALVLGKSRSLGARAALEKALADPHPAVRAAAAAGLGSIGDAGAVSALKAAATRETSASAKAQLESTIKRLSMAAAAPVKARFLLSVGTLQNRSGVTVPNVTTAFRSSTRSLLATIPGGEVLADGSDIAVESKARGLPVFALDGSLVRLSKGQTGADVSYSATVEYVIKQIPNQSLKGTVTGAAKAEVDARAIKGDSDLAQLQVDAVSAAVDSAMKAAPPALEAAYKSSGR